MDHRRRFKRVMDFIGRHLNDQIGLADLAAQANLSKFHFERVYHETIGESPIATVRRLRLARAREQLKDSRESITTIALESGFGSPQAFARAFMRTYGRTPSGVRGHARDGSASTPQIVQLSPEATRCIPFHGAAHEVVNAFDELLARAFNAGVPRSALEVWSVVDHTDERRVKVNACLMEGRLGNVRVRGLDAGTRPGGAYLKLVCAGDMHMSSETEQAAALAAELGVQLSRGPVLRRYLTDPSYIAPPQRRVELYFPIAATGTSRGGHNRNLGNATPIINF